MMKARLISDGFYEVSAADTSRSYTAKLMSSGLWFVVNDLGTAINQSSDIHRQVTAAIDLLTCGD